MTRFFKKCFWLIRASSISMSGTPSPDIADVGTREMYFFSFSFSVYSSAFSPCSANATFTLAKRSLNSCTTSASCRCRASSNGSKGRSVRFHPYSRSILFSATMNGVRPSRSRRMLSSVMGSRPCMMSTTRMATSQREEPRDRRFVNASWPGVSMIINPGTLKSRPIRLGSSGASSMIFSVGIFVAPICCVIPPASPSCTRDFRILSSNFVFPVSTWPRTQTIGDRSSVL
mmetsp:Transcript_32906/g.92146  ORF Transcript_32906/g.92146 Transcript_32906/m.92146 type:complete len:230 (+) Transcript_32906:1261-1950(+)